jgi:hypothetical protein
LFWDAATNAASWVVTGGVLSEGSYTVTLASRTDGWKDVREGELLDGDGNGTVGDDYSESFTVDAVTAPVVGLPDFTRGACQPVDVPATSTGLPISISDGTGVTSISLQLDYNYDLLHVTDAVLAAGVPGDWTWTTKDLSVPGRVILEASGATALSAGVGDVFSLTANVPGGATYRASQILKISSLVLNGGAIAGIADQAVHCAAYFGDATGNGTYSAMDASLIARVSVKLDSGFDAYATTDPVVVADVTGDGTVGAFDASYVAQKSVGLSVAEIPDLPPPAESSAPVVVSSPTTPSTGGTILVGPQTAASRPAARMLLSDPRVASERASAVDAALSHVTAKGESTKVDGAMSAATYMAEQTSSPRKDKNDKLAALDSVFSDLQSGKLDS